MGKYFLTPPPGKLLGSIEYLFSLFLYKITHFTSRLAKRKFTVYLCPYAMGAGGPILLRPPGVILLWQCIETCSIAIKVGMNRKYGSSQSHDIKTVSSTSKDTIAQHNSWLRTHTLYYNTHAHTHTHTVLQDKTNAHKNLFFATDAEFIVIRLLCHKKKKNPYRSNLLQFV